MIGVLIIAAGLTWVFASSLFGNLSEIGADISAGANKAVNWLRDNNDWARQHEDEIRSFLKGILPAAKDAAGGVFGAVLGGLSFTAQMVSGAVLMFVFLLYLLTGGDRFGAGSGTASPRRAATGSQRRALRLGARPPATSAASRSSR